MKIMGHKIRVSFFGSPSNLMSSPRSTVVVVVVVRTDLTERPLRSVPVTLIRSNQLGKETITFDRLPS